MSLETGQLKLKQRFEGLRGTWSPEWEALLILNENYFEAYLNIQDASQRKQHNSPKVQEFIYIAVAACTTHIHGPGIKAHIQSALALGATAAEITEVIGLTYLVGIHTVTLGAPILLELMEEEKIGGEENTKELDEHRERIKADFVKKRGFWPTTFQPLLDLVPDYLEAYTEFSGLPSKTNVLEPVVREIITCAFDAATTHLYARGTKVHMRNALRLGATPGQIMEMLEITSLIGIHGVQVAAPILLEQLEGSKNGNRASSAKMNGSRIQHVEVIS